MKITICGSIAFYDEMLKAKTGLEMLGHEVDIPPHEVQDEHGNMIPVKEYYAIRKEADETTKWVRERKKEAIIRHFDKIAWADAILVTNYDKNNIPHYVGANTLMEMGLALYLKKKIFLLHPTPKMNYTEELLAMFPVVLDGDLNKLI